MSKVFSRSLTASRCSLSRTPENLVNCRQTSHTITGGLLKPQILIRQCRFSSQALDGEKPDFSFLKSVMLTSPRKRLIEPLKWTPEAQEAPFKNPPLNLTDFKLNHLVASNAFARREA